MAHPPNPCRKDEIARLPLDGRNERQRAPKSGKEHRKTIGPSFHELQPDMG
jgi:hypothetical protein